MTGTVRDDRGATAVEYALMLAMITLAIFAAVTSFGIAVAGLFVADWPWN
jgi:Flp pilus assembly pilin Flp